MPMRAPAHRTGTYSGSAKAVHANKSGFGFVWVYIQAKTNKTVEEDKIIRPSEKFKYTQTICEHT